MAFQHASAADQQIWPKYAALPRSDSARFAEAASGWAAKLTAFDKQLAAIRTPG